MIRIPATLQQLTHRIPRESGDDPVVENKTFSGPSYSPRERG